MEENFDVEKHFSEVVKRFGGPFKVTSIIQKRVKALNQGAQKLVDLKTKNLFDLAFAELLEGKLELDVPDKEDSGS